MRDKKAPFLGPTPLAGTWVINDGIGDSQVTRTDGASLGLSVGKLDICFPDGDSDANVVLRVGPEVRELVGESVAVSAAGWTAGA